MSETHIEFEGKKYTLAEGIKAVAASLWAKHPNNPTNKKVSA